MNTIESIAAWDSVKASLEAKGAIFPNARMFVPDEWSQRDCSIEQLAMDAAGTLSTDPNSAIPTMLTTAIDPDVIRAIFAPLEMAEIVGERKAGDWLEQTRMFPIVEETGEVSSYDDYSNNGRVGINFNYPQFQSYLLQTILGYGELETARTGLMRINLVGELQKGASDLLNRFVNLSYAFGITGLQNYGLLNNPYVAAYLTPAVKAYGGTTWFSNGVPAATANEVYNDILTLVEKEILLTNGAVNKKSKMTLAMSPGSEVATEFVNSFGVFVEDILKKGFPNMTVKTAPQYGANSSTNSQGYPGPNGTGTAGNLLQLIVDEIQGQKVAYCAFNEKMRAHKIVPELSSWKQKMTSGTWGCIMRMPVGVVGMLGI